jgi:putative dimethyl sulfoxide reductase chaperone
MINCDGAPVAGDGARRRAQCIRGATTVTSEEQVELARARADTYRLLGRLCLAEVDERLLAALRDTPRLGPTLVGDDTALLAALRVEYTRLLIVNVLPYESVFVDQRVMLNTDATAAVFEAYREGDYRPAGQVGAPDHVGLELGFLGHLAAAEAVALAVADAEAVALSRARQRRFLGAHLGNWAPVWATALERVARQPFYAALAAVVRDFLLAELEASVAPPA